MNDCIFCKIVNGDIPTNKVYEDENVLAFKDLDPQAPIHVLVIPKKHISNTNEINGENSHIIAKIFEAIPKITNQFNLENGYRVVNNCLEDGGQTVGHLHFHLMGGRKFTWPAG